MMVTSNLNLFSIRCLVGNSLAAAMSGVDTVPAQKDVVLQDRHCGKIRQMVTKRSNDLLL